jgi:hypothetical protein
VARDVHQGASGLRYLAACTLSTRWRCWCNRDAESSSWLCWSQGGSHSSAFLPRMGEENPAAIPRRGRALPPRLEWVRQRLAPDGLLLPLCLCTPHQPHQFVDRWPASDTVTFGRRNAMRRNAMCAIGASSAHARSAAGVVGAKL